MLTITRVTQDEALDLLQQDMRRTVDRLYLDHVCRFVRAHGNAAWVLQDTIIIESHGNTWGVACTYYDAVTTLAQARDALGY